eukprot:2675281-Rhodomonas_salina.7
MGWTPLAVETAVLRVQGGLEGAAPEEVNVAVTVVRVRVEQLLNAPWMCCIKSLRTRVKMERMLADALMQVEDEDWCAAIRLVRQVRRFCVRTLARAMARVLTRAGHLRRGGQRAAVLRKDAQCPHRRCTHARDQGGVCSLVCSLVCHVSCNMSGADPAVAARVVQAGVPKEEIFHADELRRSGLLEAATAAFQRSCDAATGIVDPPSP